MIDEPADTIVSSPTDWPEGQPPPWLAQYPPQQVTAVEYSIPQIGQTIGSLPPAPPPAPPPPPSGQQQVGFAPGIAGAPDQEVAASAPAPSAASSSPPPTPADAAPDWLATAQAAGPHSIVDAISGAPAPGGQDPNAALHRIAIDPNASVADRSTAWQQLAPDERTNLVNNADPHQMAAVATAAMSPEEQATIGIKLEQAKQHQQVADMLDVARRNQETAQANMDAYQGAIQKANVDTAQLSNDAQRLSREQVDPTEHGVGHFVAQVALGMLGGFASPATGHRNLALEEFDKQSSERIQAQTAAIANQWQGLGFKRNLIQEQLQRSGDLYKAQETYRVAQYDRAATDLQTKMQDYDPQGTTALKIAGTIQQIGAARGQALQTFNNQQVKNSLDQANADKARAEADKARAEAAKLNAKLTAGAGAPSFVTAKQARAQFPQLATALGSMPDDARIPLSAPFTGTAKDYDQIVKRVGETAEGESKVVAANTAQRGTQILDGRGQPLTEDGTANSKPVTVAEKADATKINEENANLQAAIDGAREMSRILRSEPSTIDREAWAKLKGLAGPFKAEVAGLLGAKFSSREEEAIEHISSLDFDSWKRSYGEVFKADQLDQFATGLSKLGEEKVKRIGGYRGDWQKVIYDPGKLAPAQKTPEQKLVAKGSEDVMRLQRGQLTPDDQVWRDNFNVVQVGAPAYQALPPNVQRGLQTGVPPSHLEMFDQAYANALSSDKELAKQGNTYIDEMSTAGPSRAEQAYAKQLIEQLVTQNVNAASSPETPGAGVSTARDSNTPPKKAKP